MTDGVTFRINLGCRPAILFEIYYSEQF